MVKSHEDYLEQLCKMYPDIDRSVLEEVILKGMNSLQDIIRRDFDVRLEQLHSNFDKYRLIFYKSRKNIDDYKKRYFDNVYRLNKYRDKKRSKHESERLRSK